MNEMTKALLKAGLIKEEDIKRSEKEDRQELEAELKIPRPKTSWYVNQKTVLPC